MSVSRVVGGLIGISLLAIVFLFWLIYGYEGEFVPKTIYGYLPTFNAVFNLLSTVSLLLGLRFILKGRQVAHMRAMGTAFVFSTLFLISYIVHHTVNGDQVFLGTGLVKTVYLSVLFSHIFLTLFALPMVLITFYFALFGQLSLHKKIARYTFPVWLYVSVTGVVIYLFRMMFS